MFVLDARTATAHFPGIGRYVSSLAHALKPQLPEGTLTLLVDETAEARQLLPALPRLASPASPFSLHQQWMIPAQLRALRARVYHSPYYLMPYRPNVPAVLTVYDLIPLLCPQYYRPTQRLIYRATHILALHTAQAVLAISEATKRDMIRAFGTASAKITVTPLATDPHFGPRPAEIVAALRQRLGLPEIYWLYFGSNKPHKNLSRLVEAFGKSQIPTSKIQLLIAGQWDARYPDAKRIVEKQGWADRVKFIGPVPEADLPALYTGAALFIFPSEYEGFGLPALEAMACGTPVACANTSSLPEVVGEAAWAFDPTSTEAIAEVLRHIASNPAMLVERRTVSLNRAAHFAWASTAARTAAVYQSLIT